MQEITIQKIQKLAPIFSEEQIQVIQSTIAKGTTAAELGLFLFTAMTVGLNPLNKEIYCYKDRQKNLIIFTGRDGMLRKAQENPKFDGIRSCEIRENDEGWAVDVPNGIIRHTITKAKKDRGAILGAYCLVFRAEGQPTLEWVDFDTYNKGTNVWQSDPAAMIRKVAESHALKKAFGLAGIQLEEDWIIKDNQALPIDTIKGAQKTDPLTEKQLELIEALEHYQGEDIDEIRDRCATARNLGELDIPFINGILQEMGARPRINPEAEEIDPEDLQAAADYYDANVKPRGSHKGPAGPQGEQAELDLERGEPC